MKIQYEAEVINITKVGKNDDGSDKILSTIEWQRSKYVSESVHIFASLPLGQKCLVTVETVDEVEYDQEYLEKAGLA